MKHSSISHSFGFILSICLLLSVIPSNVFVLEGDESLPETLVENEKTYVAKVGDQSYESLPTALEAASSGSTIVLLSDVELNDDSSIDGRYNLFIDKDITIDGNNHTIKNGKTRGIGVQAANVTFKNLTIVNELSAGRGIDTRGDIENFTLENVTINTPYSAGGAGSNPQPLTIGGSQATNANVTIKNSSINAGKLGYSITMFNPVTMTIENSELNGWGNLYFKGPSGSTGTNNSTINVNNSHLISTNANAKNDVNNFGAVIYEDVENNEVVLNDCEVEISSPSGNYQEIFTFSNGWGSSSCRNYVKGNSTITLKDANSLIVDMERYVEDFKANNLIEIQGGTFNIDVTPLCAEGLKAFKRGENKWVIEDENIVEMNGVKYASLQEAVDAATGPSTIKLLKDVEGNGVKAVEGKDIIFDFNGHTYKINSKLVGSTGTETNGFQLLKGSKVKIMNGTLDAGKSAKILVQKYGDLVLEDMNLLGGPQTSYVLSNNNAKTTLTGNTNITATEGNFAMDCYYWPSNSYGDNYVEAKDLTGKITGNIEHTHDSTVSEEEAKQHSGIELSSGEYTIDPTPFAKEGLEIIKVGQNWVVKAPEAKPEVKPEVKPETKPVDKPVQIIPNTCTK